MTALVDLREIRCIERIYVNRCVSFERYLPNLFCSVSKFADFSLAVARFFARITTFALMINEHAINVKHFLRRIVEMFTINHILDEFRFFVNVFLRKIAKNV